jgi:hypothetical protein
MKEANFVDIVAVSGHIDFASRKLIPEKPAV